MNYLKTDVCHIHLIALASEFRKLVKNDLDYDTIANKLRNFFIPLFSLLESDEQSEPEIVNAIRKILKSKKVLKILESVECDHDEVPMLINDESIPDLLNLNISDSFFKSLEKVSRAHSSS